jgi:vesicle transport protein SEC22
LCSYQISDQICYLTITDKSYPRKLAFSYLEELAKEFGTSYGQEALKPNLRPYAFVQFDTFISATKRVYQDSRAQTNLDRLNVELQDVTRVMTKNIEDLIYRGDSLDRKSPPRITASCPSRLFLHFSVSLFSCLSVVRLMAGMSNISSSLRDESAKYRKQARQINLMAMWRQYGPIGIIAFFFLFIIYWRFFW